MRFASCCAFLTLVSCLLLESDVSGQFGRFQATPDQTDFSRIFHPAPRVLRQYLTRAEKAIEEERYSDAVEHLYAVLTVADSQGDLDEALTQDYLLPEPNSKTISSSVRSQAQRLLGSMPKRGREMFELRCGAEARTNLNNAVAKGDVNLLADVTRKYFHTKAGYEASFLLGQFHLQSGRPLAGALVLRRLLQSPVATEYDPDLPLLVASCWLQANHPEKAKETVLALKKRDPRIRIALEAEKVDIFQSDANALAWIQQTLGKSPNLKTFDASQWTMFGGSPDRNATVKGANPVLHARWHMKTAADDLSGYLEDHARAFRSEGTPLVAATSPLVIDGTVLMRTPDLLMGVDIKTGKRVWQFPAAPASGPSEIDAQVGNAQVSNSRKEKLIARVWGDHPYGQMSSDGSTIYLLDKLKTPTTSNNSQAMLQQRIMFGGRRSIVSDGSDSNVLVALRLSHEGARSWMVGGEKSPVEELKEAFFLGPPLPLSGHVYALAEIQGEVRLVVLDGKSGKLLWKQQLAHVSNQRVQFDVDRRLAGATPSFADGIMICPTSAGAITAVDISTRTLLWGYMYGKPRITTMRNRFRSATTTRSIESRWADPNVKIANGSVVVTPIESDELHCLDLLTGKPRWAPIKRDNMVFVAGIHDGKIIAVEKRGIVALKTSDGTEAWRMELKDAVPSGRGFMSDGQYFLPASNSRLVTVNLDNGKVTREVVTDRVLGNLVSYEDQIISQTESEISSFYQQGPLQARVAEELANDPSNEWAMRWQSELLLQDGKQQQALDLLRRALKQHPESITVQTLLVKTLFNALEDDFATNSESVAEIEDLITEPQRERFQRLMAIGLAKTGKHAEAARMTLKILGVKIQEGEPATLPHVGSGSRLSREFDRDWHGRLDRWAAAHLSGLLRKLAAAKDDSIEKVVQQLFEDASAEDSPLKWRLFTEMFIDHPLADRARLVLAKHDADESPLQSQLMLASLLESKQDDVAALASVEMARHHLAAGNQSAAAHLIKGVKDRWPSTDLSALPAELRNGDSSAMRPFRDRQVRVDLPTGKRTLAGPFYETHVIDWRNQPNSNATVRIERNKAVVVSDAYGNELHRAGTLNNVSSEPGRKYQNAEASACGNLLVLGNNYANVSEVIAFNLSSASSGFAEDLDPVLWRKRLANGSSSSIATQASARSRRTKWGQRIWTRPQTGVGVVSLNGITVLDGHKLSCVEPLSGDTIWERDSIPENVKVVGDDRHVVVIDFNKEVTKVYDIIDGSLLKTTKIDADEFDHIALGTHLLTWGTGNRVKLVDVLDGKTLWERRLAPASKGYHFDVDKFAMMQRDGSLQVLSIRTGEILLDTQAEPAPSLQTLHAFASQDQFILVTSRQVSAANVGGVSFQPISANGLDEIVTGRIYAFDRRTREPSWPVPAHVENFGLLVNQPTESPMLIFVRHELRSQSSTGISSRPQMRSAVLGIDKRTGHRVLDVRADKLPFKTSAVKITTDPTEETVTVIMSSQPIVARYHSAVVPPEPPFQGEAAAIPVPNLSEQFKGMIEIFGPAFRKR